MHWNKLKTKMSQPEEHDPEEFFEEIAHGR